MKGILKNIAKIEKFSKIIFFVTFIKGLILLIFGNILHNNFRTFDEMFLSRQIIETAYVLFAVSFFLTLVTDILIKKEKNKEW